MAIPNEYVQVLIDAGYDPVEVELMLAPVANLGPDAPIAAVDALQPNLRESEDARRAAVSAARVDWWSADPVDDTYRRLLDATVEHAEDEVAQEAWQGAPVFKAWTALVRHLDDSPSARLAWERHWQDSTAALLDEHGELVSVPLTFPYESYTAESLYTNLRALELHDTATGVQLASYLFGVAEGVVKAYNPNQTRHPKGDPRGGQWRDDDGMAQGGAISELDAALLAAQEAHEARQQKKNDFPKEGKSVLVKRVGTVLDGYIEEYEYRFSDKGKPRRVKYRTFTAEIEPVVKYRADGSADVLIKDWNFHISADVMQREQPLPYDEARKRVYSILDRLQTVEQDFYAASITNPAAHIPETDRWVTLSELVSGITTHGMLEIEPDLVQFRQEYVEPLKALLKQNFGTLNKHFSRPVVLDAYGLKPEFGTEELALSEADFEPRPDESGPDGDYNAYLDRIEGIVRYFNHDDLKKVAFTERLGDLVRRTLFEVNYTKGRESTLADMPGFKFDWATTSSTNVRDKDGKLVTPYIFAIYSPYTTGGDVAFESIRFSDQHPAQANYYRALYEGRKQVIAKMQANMQRFGLLANPRVLDFERMQDNFGVGTFEFTYEAKPEHLPEAETSLLAPSYYPGDLTLPGSEKRARGIVASDWQYGPHGNVIIPPEQFQESVSGGRSGVWSRLGATITVQDDGFRAQAGTEWEKAQESNQLATSQMQRMLTGKTPERLQEILNNPFAYRTNIQVPVSVSSSTFTHEWGHVLEKLHPNLTKAAVDFLERRAGNTPMEKMRLVAGSNFYNDGEVTRKDRFFDPYVGKIYREMNGRIHSTEIVSMGVEELISDPVHFAKVDPEHFDLSLRVLLGDPALIGGNPHILSTNEFKRDSL